MFSLLIIVALLLVLFVFFSSDAFYVHSIAVGGTHYLPKEEIFALTGIANMHVFWVDPAAVRQSLLRSSSIAEAEVSVGWPPNMVQVVVAEREPAMIWVQSGTTHWIDLQGRVMQVREERDDLVRVIAGNDVDEGPLGQNVRVSTDVVNGALQLYELLPAVSELRYHPIKGLGFRDDNGTNIWFGTGPNMPEKIVVYQAIAEDMRGRGMQPYEINVANPDAPYVCPDAARCGV